jgi:hypothetical protein
MYRRLVTSILVLLAFASGAFADPIITGSKPFTFTPGTTISSSQVNADYDYIINQVNANGAKNGVNSSITALLGITTPLAVTSGGSPIWTATSVGGTANAITVTATTPAISSYSLTKGNILSLQPTSNNTGSVTLNVNSLGAVNVFKNTLGGLIALQSNDLTTNQVYSVYYDGTNYILLNPNEGFGPAFSIASAATTDLGTGGSHNITITGSTGITSFGSTANVAQPIYYLRFTGAPTLTHNGTSLILPGAINLPAIAGDTALAEYLGSGNWRVAAYNRNTPSAPTIQRFTTGTSLTYTPTSGTQYIRVRMIAGAGGGGAQTTNNGSNGTATSFGSWTAIAGSGGSVGGGGTGGGAGGTGGVDGTGTLVVRFSGAAGMGGAGGGTNPTISGGMGGSSPFGGAGASGNNFAGQSAKANTGSGGGGAGAPNGINGSNGGGAGEYVEFYVSNPAATTYTVGTGGNGGAAGTLAGGNGAAGVIIVEEYNR